VKRKLAKLDRLEVMLQTKSGDSFR
jgi:hypothetical protein